MNGARQHNLIILKQIKRVIPFIHKRLYLSFLETSYPSKKFLYRSYIFTLNKPKYQEKFLYLHLDFKYTK